MAGSRSQPKDDRRDQLPALLRNLLTPGPMPSSEVVEKAKDAGFGKDATWKAKNALQSRARKDGMRGGGSGNGRSRTPKPPKHPY